MISKVIGLHVTVFGAALRCQTHNTDETAFVAVERTHDERSVVLS